MVSLKSPLNEEPTLFRKSMTFKPIKSYLCQKLKETHGKNAKSGWL